MSINIQHFKTPYGELILGEYNGKICLCDWRYRKMRQTIDDRIQEGLKDKFVEASVAGGSIKVKANGQKEIVDLDISLDILKDAVNDEDTSMITDLILSAVNEVMTKAEEMAEKEMEVVTGGVNIPGLF